MIETEQIKINDIYGLGIKMEVPRGIMHLIIIDKWLISDGSIDIHNLEKKYSNICIVEIISNNFTEMLSGKIKRISNNGVLEGGDLNKRLKDIIK